MIKRTIIFILLTVIISCKTHYQAINASRFEHYFQTRKIYSIMIDFRSKELFKKSHLIKAHHISIDSNNLKEQVFSKFAKEPGDVWVLFVYAQTKKQTDVLLQKLKQSYSRYLPFSGPTAIYYLHGGYEMLKKK